MIVFIYQPNYDLTYVYTILKYRSIYFNFFIGIYIYIYMCVYEWTSTRHRGWVQTQWHLADNCVYGPHLPPCLMQMV